MCNLYSITTNHAAIIALFRVMNRYVGNLQPMKRCWIGTGQLCHSKHETTACPRAGPRIKRDARVISVNALSRKLIITESLTTVAWVQKKKDVLLEGP